MLINTFAKGKCGVGTFQCSLTHLPNVNIAYAPSSAPIHICLLQMWRTHLIKNIIIYFKTIINKYFYNMEEAILEHNDESRLDT